MVVPIIGGAYGPGSGRTCEKKPLDFVAAIPWQYFRGSAERILELVLSDSNNSLFKVEAC
jgi:hypothetical protein